MFTQDLIFKCLAPVVLPNGQRLIEAKMLSSLVIKESGIGFALDCKPEDFPYALELKEKCTKLLKEKLKLDHISIVLTSGHNFDERSFSQSKNLVKLNPSSIKKIIWVTSCKGGVGKSTLTYLIAKSWAASGIKVGVLDADIYGPSIPQLFGMTDDIALDDNMIIPFSVDKVEFISLGNVIDKDKAGIWRGPMVSKNIHQLLYKTNWSELDILLIDMPPGTGDVALTLAEGCSINGAIIVTTPSRLAFADNIKTIDMLNKFAIPVLAVIENMSYLELDSQILKPFGEGASDELAQLTNCKKLIKLPLDKNIEESGSVYLKGLDGLI